MERQGNKAHQGKARKGKGGKVRKETQTHGVKAWKDKARHGMDKNGKAKAWKTKEQQSNASVSLTKAELYM